jgi:hypothetical protein
MQPQSHVSLRRFLPEAASLAALEMVPTMSFDPCLQTAALTTPLYQVRQVSSEDLDSFVPVGKTLEFFALAGETLEFSVAAAPIAASICRVG